MRRLIVFFAAIALVASLAGPGVALASNRPVEYLALGDSLAFGFNPLADPTDPAHFVGYPERATIALRDTLTNASCPGETSSHLINLAGSDNGCGTWRGLGLPLHVGYASATQSQLAFADAFLKEHPKTQVVSLDIGANDVFVLQKSCGYDAGCILAGLPNVVATFSANLDTIYGHLRHEDGYNHKLVALSFYARDYVSDPVSTAVASLMRDALKERTEAWGGVLADGFEAFRDASAPYGGDTCAAGLRIVLSTSPLVCDDHPSPLGRDLLAQALVNALRPD